MFMKLFRYISGSNVGGNKIKMTVPVSMRMKKLNGDSFEKEMCFYLDSANQANPPQPTNADVYIVNRPAMNIYTRLVNIWNKKTFFVSLSVFFQYVFLH